MTFDSAMLQRVLAHADAIVSSCSYCKKSYRLVAADGFPGISHGICEKCVDSVKASFRAAARTSKAAA